MTAMTWSHSGSTLGNLAYTYNSLGQRSSMSGSFARLLPATATRLTIGNDGRVATENGKPVTFDANGRLTQDSQYTYVWNELGLLAEVHTLSDNTLLASYQYDASGRRIASTINGSTTHYLYASDNPIQLQDSTGKATQNLLAGGTDEWFAETGNSQTQVFLTDALGSTLRLTDMNGNKLVDSTYDAYGNFNTDAATSNHFGYTGREMDGNGLYNYRARYYKPAWRQFISQDPIGLAGGMNPYSYVGGNPLSFIDPFGLATIYGVPSGSVQYVAPDGQTFYAPSYANFQAVLAAGQTNGMTNLSGINSAIGQGGTFDFQRSGGNFYPTYTNASNYAVGVYMEGAGYPEGLMNLLGDVYARFKSSNSGTPKQPMWWDNGWNAAHDGKLCNSCPCH